MSRDFNVGGMEALGRDLAAKAALVQGIATNLSSFSALDEDGLTPTNEYRRWNEAWTDELRQVADLLTDLSTDLVAQAQALSELDDVVGRMLSE